MNPYRSYMQKVAGLPVLAQEALHGAARVGLGGAVVGGLAGARKDENGERHILGGALKGALIGGAVGGAGGAAVGHGLRQATRVGMGLTRQSAVSFAQQGKRLATAGDAVSAAEHFETAKGLQATAQGLRHASHLPFAGLNVKDLVAAKAAAQ